jgi:hypothetical protein
LIYVVTCVCCCVEVAFWGLYYVYCAVRLHVSNAGEGLLDLSEDFAWQNGFKVPTHPRERERERV